VKAGDELTFMGPQRSLSLDPGPVILVGDETSVAVAASFELERPGQVHGVFLVQAPDAAREAAQAVGVRSAHVAVGHDIASAVEAVVVQRAKSPRSVGG
jgi:NADPH-dependent ferric siderophore reductase